MKKVMVLMAVSMSLVSCASIEVQDLNFEPKVMHFDSPETVGSLGSGNLMMHMEKETPSFLLGSATNLSALGGSHLFIDTTKYASAHSSNYGVRGDVGLSDMVDVFYAGDGMFGVKLQLLGASQALKEKGFKLSISAGRGEYSTHNGVSVLDIINLFTTSDLSSETVVKVNDLSLNMGYRLNDTGIIYCNTFLQQSSLKGDIYQASDSNVPVYSTQEKSESKGLLVGLRLHLETGAMITLEVGAVQSTLLGLDTLTSYPVGVSSGGSW